MTGTTEGTFTPPPPAPPQEPAPPARSGWARLAGVLFTPGETFREIVRKPDFLVPLVVIIVLSLASAAVIAPRVDFESEVRAEIAKGNQNMSAEDADRIARFSAAFAKAILFAMPFINLIIYAAVAGIFLLAFRLFGGEGGYKGAFSVTLYAWMPVVLQGVVAMIILLTRGEVSGEELNNLVMSNLGFLAGREEHPVAFAFLSSLDLFAIWSLVLFTIGFSELSRLSRGQSAAIVGTLWGIVVMIKVGWAAVFGSGAPGA